MKSQKQTIFNDEWPSVAAQDLVTDEAKLQLTTTRFHMNVE